MVNKLNKSLPAFIGCLNESTLDTCRLEFIESNITQAKSQ